MSTPYLSERGVSREEGFDGAMVKRSAETAQTATAEQNRAVVQARFLMAINRPRNYENARLDIIKTCQRPTFTAKARYKKPQWGAKACGRADCPQEKRQRGKDLCCDHICGLSIRAADEFAKFYGNVQTEQMTVFDDDEQRIVGVAATDLEHNITKSVTITIRKIVERKDPKDRIVISRRENSNGDAVCLVRATDDEILQKEGALCAKARRNLLLQLIPADLLEEAEDYAFETSIKEDAADPDLAKKKLIAGFDAIGVRPSDLEAYLMHSLDGLTSAETADLRSVYMAINEGEAKWADFVKAMGGEDEEANSKVDTAKAKMRDKLNKRKAKDDVPAEPSQPDYLKAYGDIAKAYAAPENQGRIDELVHKHGLPGACFTDIEIEQVTDEHKAAIIAIAAEVAVQR